LRNLFNPSHEERARLALGVKDGEKDTRGRHTNEKATVLKNRARSSGFSADIVLDDELVYELVSRMVMADGMSDQDV